MTKQELVQSYHFSDEELLLNKTGTISPKQREKIQSQYAQQLRLFKQSTIKDTVGFMSILAVANLLAILWYDDLFYNFVITTVILIPASAVLYSKIFAKEGILSQIKLMHEFLTNLPNISKCSRIQKTDFHNLTPHLDDWYESVEVECDVKLEISPSQFEALSDDTFYTFYYIAGLNDSTHILSLEVDSTL